MDERFAIYNLHINYGAEYFLKNDPQLNYVSQLPLSYTSPLINELPVDIPGIYTLGGGRQIGKSTLLKQWMAKLMTEDKIAPSQILFFTGDIIDDHHQLLQILNPVLIDTHTENNLIYIVIDEVTYIKDWDKCIKFLADSRQLSKAVLMLSGSDLTMIEEARMRFPGRRGEADIVDFHLYPLSFSQYLQLAHPALATIVHTDDILQKQALLLDAFNLYLQHGGYLRAINELEQKNIISNATITTYSDWIRGDIRKRNKQETYLKELMGGVLKHYTSQITWNNLAKNLSIDHHKTVADYVSLLSHMDALFVQHALIEDKLAPAPKKAKKVFFTDPFVFHAMNTWMHPSKNIYQDLILPAVNSADIAVQLVETIVVNHFRRKYETYYIKAEGEIDIAYIDQNKFWPIELKWRNQLRPKELKQISKYANAQIWTKSMNTGDILGIKTSFLPLALARLDLT